MLAKKAVHEDKKAIIRDKDTWITSGEGMFATVKKED